MIWKLLLCLMFLPACGNAAECLPGYYYIKNKPTDEKICDDVSFTFDKACKHWSFDQMTVKDYPVISGKTAQIKYQCSFCYKCEGKL